jgi:hypothetical protein
MYRSIAAFWTLTESSSTRTLSRALEHAGSIAALAQRLHVPEAALEEWLAGAVAVPLDVYLSALDLVSQGSLWRPENSKRPPE